MKNNHTFLSVLIAFGLLFLTVPPVAAQRTLGALEKDGARKLEADDVKKLLVGHTFIRGNRQSQSVHVSLLPDGSLTGRRASSLGISGVIGTWTVAADGKMCATYRFTDGRTAAFDWCGYHYSLGPRYFVVLGEQIQSAPRFRVWIVGLDDDELPVPEN
jgi:hypothetical protein